jgi:tetratricopeptide (TPR) repeat protein
VSDEHLRSDHYVTIGDTDSSASMLARRTHDHLVATCPECRLEWDALGALQDTYLAGLRNFTTPPAPAGVSDDDLEVTDASIAAWVDHADEIRYHRRRAQEQMSILRRLPPEKRAGRIRRAHSQFRGFMFAELLIEECRRTVRTAPAEALSWVELVPVALEWTRGNEVLRGAPAILARAAAHRANALRVLGEHPRAEAAFVALRRSLATLPVDDPAVVAEVASLEASLRIAQHHYAHAEDLLQRAALAYRYAGDALGVVRARVKHANLARRQGRPSEVLELLADAVDGLAAAPPVTDLHLILWIATARANALCDLGRFGEARELLDQYLDDYEASDDPHSAAVFRCLEGRVALGLEDIERAEDAFVSCRDALLTIGRAHDAALASLYHAETLLAAGRTDDLRRLAARLVPLFGKRDLPEETASALRFLAQAIAAQRLTAAVVDKLRERIASAGAASFLGPF